MADFNETVLLVLHEDEDTILKITKWSDNGKPCIAKQGKWIDNEGNVKCGKLKSLMPNDLEVIFNRAEEIKKIMSISEQIDKEMPPF